MGEEGWGGAETGGNGGGGRPIHSPQEEGELFLKVMNARMETHANP